MAGECDLCRGTMRVEIFLGCGTYVREECPRCLRAGIKRLTDLREQVAAAHRRGQEAMRARAAAICDTQHKELAVHEAEGRATLGKSYDPNSYGAGYASGQLEAWTDTAYAIRALPIEEPQR